MLYSQDSLGWEVKSRGSEFKVKTIQQSQELVPTVLTLRFAIHSPAAAPSGETTGSHLG